MSEAELLDFGTLDPGNPESPFTPQEFWTRVARVQERLAQRNWQGILVSDPANIYYLTGYNAWSFYMPQLLFVPTVGTPLLMMRQMDAQGAHRTAVICGDDVAGYPESLVHQTGTHPGRWMAEALRERGWAEGSRPAVVAYEGDAHYFSIRTFLALQAGLPEWQFVDSGELVNWVRAVKSPAEIALMRGAGQVATRCMRTALGAIHAGVPLNQIAGEVARAQAYGVPAGAELGEWGAHGIGPASGGGTAPGPGAVPGAGSGFAAGAAPGQQMGPAADGDYPAIVPMFPRGAGADTPHLTWTSQPVAAGEAVSIELAGAHRRYHAPLARTVSVGTPGSELDRVAKVTAEGLAAALEFLVPGSTPAQVVAAWDSVLARNGLEKRSRLGYSIGVGYPPDWGEHTISLRADDHTELEENMTFHVIAGMWMTGYGFEASESVRVAPGGPELLADVPRDLAQVDG